LKLSQILKQPNDLTITSEDEESDGSTRHSDSISFNENANNITETNSSSLKNGKDVHKKSLSMPNKLKRSKSSKSQKKIIIRKTLKNASSPSANQIILPISSTVVGESESFELGNIEDDVEIDHLNLTPNLGDIRDLSEIISSVRRRSISIKDARISKTITNSNGIDNRAVSADFNNIVSDNDSVLSEVDF
jgi:hypothetical protein